MGHDSYMFDWNELAFGSKKAINSLHATFIAAPRELSEKRIKQLVQTYLPKGPMVFGIAKEPCVAGFEGQPQFKTLSLSDIKDIAKKVNSQASKNKIYILEYFQRDAIYLLDKLKFKRIVLINGSWKYAFHTREAFYTITKRQTPYEMVSPFLDEMEAQTYSETAMRELRKTIKLPTTNKILSETDMLEAAQTISNYSFDYNFQTGVSLGKKTTTGKYTFLGATYNKVVPYQTYAMHYGASREKNYSPTHDLNHYDTVHAEVELLITAGRKNINLKGATVFINLLPCPACSRMLSETSITELVYTEDHSEGYAVLMLESAGKIVRRVVTKGGHIVMKVFAIASVTADGYIGKTADHLADWTSPEDKKLFVRLTKEAGVMVMGSRTFATIGRALPERRTIVYTSKPEQINVEGIETTSEAPANLVSRLAKEGAAGVAICGGAIIYSMFMAAGLIDELYLTVEPVLFGAGVPLFSKELEVTMSLLDTSRLNDNTVLLHYQIDKRK